MLEKTLKQIFEELTWQIDMSDSEERNQGYLDAVALWLKDFEKEIRTRIDPDNEPDYFQHKEMGKLVDYGGLVLLERMKGEVKK